MEQVLALPLAEALEMLCASGRPVRVLIATPPVGVSVVRWRAARVTATPDGGTTVTAVGEIEGTIGCSERLKPT